MEKSKVPEIVDLVVDENDDHKDEADEFLPIPNSDEGASKDLTIPAQHTRDLMLLLAVASAISSAKEANFTDFFNGFHSILDCNDDPRLLNMSPTPPISSNNHINPRKFQDSVTETGEPSSCSASDPTLVCEICYEIKKPAAFFSIKNCGHSYCAECIINYVNSKLQLNITIIQCPVLGCYGSLELEFCRSILPQAMFDRWGNSLCEASIPFSQRFYCPFKDCSALLINDGKKVVVVESFCRECGRMFCAQCKSPWHDDMSCEEFQKLGYDDMNDVFLMEMAKDESWKRCPGCRIYIERTEGCNSMICWWCLTDFCYICGSTNVSTVAEGHFCARCGLLPPVQRNRTESFYYFTDVGDL